MKWCSTYLEKDSGREKRKVVDSDAQGSVAEPEERPIELRQLRLVARRRKVEKKKN